MSKWRGLTTDERFHKKYAIRQDGCWEWQGSVIPQRASGHNFYGVFYWDGKQGYAHRYAYEQAHGAMPEGLVTDHLCRRTRCVNPDHLEPVTHKENILRGVGACSVNARKTHCKHGHEFTKENTYIRPMSRRGRDCQTCKGKRNRISYLKLRVK